MDYVTSRVPAAKDDRHAWAEPGVEDLGGGLFRIPLPLPGDALTAVNVYAMTGDHGVDLIDAGMALVQARERLTEALGQLGYGLPDIRNFFITHIHQDHYTLAVELRTTLRGQITLGDQERANMDAIRDVSAGRAEVGFIEMLGPMGAAELAAQVRARLAPRLADPQPKLEWSDPDRWLPDGAVIDLPGRTLRAIHTPGHTTGHVVFHDEAAGLLFAGDHVLPSITPSIGVESASAAQPLGDFLSSLAKVRALPDLRLLPAHGPVAPSTHGRVDELIAHHEERLALCEQAVAAGAATAYDVAQQLPWTRRATPLAELDLFNAALATLETFAHLELLAAQGRVDRAEDDGVVGYAPGRRIGTCGMPSSTNSGPDGS